MKCPNCTLQLPDHADFCAFCGEPVKRCGQCALTFTKDVEFCGQCGQPLQPSQEPPFERRRAVFQTSPGLPGKALDEDTPTFVLPAQSEQNNPKMFGYLYDPEAPMHRFSLHSGDNTLGAGHNNDIVIDQPAVSWNHALIICRNQKVFLQDSASTNGTFINGKRIDRPFQLHNADAVRFGDVGLHVWLKTRYRS